MFVTLLKGVPVATDLFNRCFGVKLLHEYAKLPTKGSGLSAGYDLYCAGPHYIKAQSSLIIPLGISAELPEGYYGRIADRSGLAAKHGFTVLAGVIDNDYRGEWKVILLNTGEFGVPIHCGTRVAQVILTPYGDFNVEEIQQVSDTNRGAGGFGSTGI